MKTTNLDILHTIYEHLPQGNSFMNAISQLLLIFCSLVFVWFVLPKINFKPWIRKIIVFGCATTIGGSFFRLLIDTYYFFTSSTKTFVWYEALAALTRNYGFPIIFFAAIFFGLKQFQQNQELIKKLKNHEE